jgi:hypothetical protein
MYFLYKNEYGILKPVEITIRRRLMYKGENREYTWKCHNETSCIAIFNKQKCLFSKMENKKVKQVLSGD